MNESEIERLENALHKKIPNWYKIFLLNYPEELILLGAPYNTVSELSLPNNTDRIIQINEFESPPANILVIGEDGLGNFYYVILDNHDEKIYLFNHEEPIFIDDNEEIIDWNKSCEYYFENLDELITDLKENFTEE